MVFMKKVTRRGLVQTVFPSMTVPKALKREAKKRGITVAALTRQVLKEFLDGQKVTEQVRASYEGYKVDVFPSEKVSNRYDVNSAYRVDSK